MMKKIAALMVAAMIANPSHATNSNSNAAAAASASNRAVLEGQQNQSISVFAPNTITLQGSQRPLRNNPGIFLGMPNPTSNCMAVIGGGAVFSGIGFTAAGSFTNENCEIQEAARNMYYMGDVQTAMEIACKGKHARHTTRCTEINATSNDANTIAATREKRPFDASDW